jgi:alpha-beta hydrolase superfamily lysophospholipase
MDFLSMGHGAAICGTLSREIIRIKGFLSMSLIKSLGIFLLSIPIVTLAGAAGLILSQPPAQSIVGSDAGGNGTGLAFGGLTLPSDPAPLVPFKPYDGSTLHLRHYPSTNPDAPLLVLLHGSGWHGLQYDALGKRLAADGLAEVLAPDLRGHGPLTQARGQAEYADQIEDDIADMIAAYARDGQEVILGGMSLGGGTVIRFANGPHRALIQRALLMAPFLYNDAPTTRENSGGWAQPLLRRFIGLTILNRFHITAFNHLTVLQFRFPAHILAGPAGASVTPDYSWTLYYGLVPRADWRADVAALPPFLLIAGAQDEAFFAERYAPVMSDLTANGTYQVLDGVGHLGIVDAPATYNVLRDWLARTQPN